MTKDGDYKRIVRRRARQSVGPNGCQGRVLEAERRPARPALAGRAERVWLNEVQEQLRPPRRYVMGLDGKRRRQETPLTLRWGTQPSSWEEVDATRANLMSYGHKYCYPL